MSRTQYGISPRGYENLSDAALDALIEESAALPAGAPREQLLAAMAQRMERVYRGEPGAADLATVVDLARRVLATEPPNSDNACQARILRASAAALQILLDPPPVDRDTTVTEALDGLPEALDRLGPDTVDLLDLSNAMTVLYAYQYDRTHDSADLDRLLQWQRRLVDAQDDPLPADLAELSWLLLRRAATPGTAGDPGADRLAALTTAEQALGSVTEEDTNRPMIIGLVGRARALVYEGHPDGAESARAVKELTTALELLPSDHPYRTDYAVSLGLTLFSGTRRMTSRTDQREAVQDLRAALALFDGILGDAVQAPEPPDPQTLYVACMAGIASLSLSQLIVEPPLLTRGIQLMEYGLKHLTSEEDAGLRAMVSGFLGVALLETAYQGLLPAGEYARIDELLAFGAAHDNDPQRVGAFERSRLTLATVAPLSSAQGDPDAATATLQAWLDNLPHGNADRIVLTINLSAALYQRYLRTAVLSDLDLAIDYGWRAVHWADRSAPDFILAAMGLGAALAARVRFNPRPLDVERLPEVQTLVRQAAASAGDAHPLTARLAELQAALALVAPENGGSVAPARLDAAIDQLNRARSLESNPIARANLTVKVGSLLATRAVNGTPDRALLDRGLALLRAEESAAGGPFQRQARAALGTVLWTAYRTFGNIGYLTEAIAYLERDDTSADTVGLFYDTYGLLGTLAEAHRAAIMLDPAHAAASRAAGLASLAQHTRKVLLQDGAGESLVTAAAVARQALMVAGWCVHDGVLNEAISALETGRGLVLYAATAAATVPELLRQHGEPALAAEWETARRQLAPAPFGLTADWAVETGATVLPDDLRRRTLAVLDGAGARGPGLVRPPDVADIKRALEATGNDGLCYLLPRSAHNAGCALVIRPAGEPFSVPLPDLDYAAEPVRAYWAALRDRDETPSGTSPAEAIATWCDWAWPAAVGPLLDALRAAGAPAEPRLVLVGVGEYGELPWAAARRTDPYPGTVRYAVEEAVFSCVPTARLLCQVAHRGYLPLNGSALVIGNPGDDPGLAASAVEAETVHDQFYPAGSDPSEPATPAVVLAALPGGTAPQPVVHLAGHAHLVRGSPMAAALTLAGGTRLTIQDVLTQSRQVPQETPGPLIDLGACTSGVTSGQRDEALSLAAAFLVAGATGVVGTLWEVSDRRAAALQYLFHHNLVRLGLPPVLALRQAQLTFLRPGPLPRDVPAGLRLPDGRAVVDHPIFWAAFTMHGR